MVENNTRKPITLEDAKGLGEGIVMLACPLSVSVQSIVSLAREGDMSFWRIREYVRSKNAFEKAVISYAEAVGDQGVLKLLKGSNAPYANGVEDQGGRGGGGSSE